MRTRPGWLPGDIVGLCRTFSSGRVTAYEFSSVGAVGHVRPGQLLIYVGSAASKPVVIADGRLVRLSVPHSFLSRV